jgi:hypothetical protein
MEATVMNDIGFSPPGPRPRGINVEGVNARNKGIRRIHLGLVLAELICIPAFVFELMRAVGGNELSWAYVFEWPLLGGYAVYMWRKLLASERAEHDQTSAPRKQELDDPDLVAWNAYLAQVHASDQSKQSKERRD